MLGGAWWAAGGQTRAACGSRRAHCCGARRARARGLHLTGKGRLLRCALSSLQVGLFASTPFRAAASLSLYGS